MSEYTTTWKNDTQYTASFKVLTEKKGGAKGRKQTWLPFVIEPGQSVEIPAEFDGAIRQENKFGRIIGGLCPWLKKKGEDQINLHPCLDFIKVKREMDVRELAAKIREENSLAEAYQMLDNSKTEKPSRNSK